MRVKDRRRAESCPVKNYKDFAGVSAGRTRCLALQTIQGLQRHSLGRKQYEFGASNYEGARRIRTCEMWVEGWAKRKLSGGFPSGHLVICVGERLAECKFWIEACPSTRDSCPRSFLGTDF